MRLTFFRLPQRLLLLSAQANAAKLALVQNLPPQHITGRTHLAKDLAQVIQQLLMQLGLQKEEFYTKCQACQRHMLSKQLCSHVILMAAHAGWHANDPKAHDGVKTLFQIP